MKKLSLLLVFCVVALSMTPLCGCHGSQQTASFVIPETFDESKDYEITFWAKNDTNKNQTDVYNRAAEQFHELYPNVTVNIRLYTDYKRIYNDVITNIATNTTPNVCITYPDHIATYRTGTNVVVPLSALFADEAYGLGGSALRYEGPSFDELIPEFLEECSFDGDYFAIPFMRSTEICYVNQTFVEALGYELPDVLTWDYIWEVSEAATAKGADGTYQVNGQNVMIPFIYKSTDNMMITALEQLGADYSNENGEVLIFNDATHRLLEEVSAHIATGAFSTFKIASYPANFLNAGQCIFAIDSSAGSTWMGPKAPLSDISEDAIVDFETAVRLVPQFDPEHPRMISQGPSVCLFNKTDAQEVLAAWLFAQYLLTDEVQMAYAETEGYIPVTTRATNHADYQAYLENPGWDNQNYQVKIDATKLFIENTSNTFTTAVFNGSASLRSAAGELIEETAKSTLRGETIDDAYFDKLYAKMVSLYHLDSLSASSEEKAAFDGLPDEALALLISLGAVWLILGAVALIKAIQKKK